MDESSEGKVFVRSANDVSGCSITQKLRCKISTLDSTYVEYYRMLSLSFADGGEYQWGEKK